MGENQVRNNLEALLVEIEQKREQNRVEEEANRIERALITEQYFTWHTEYNKQNEELNIKKMLMEKKDQSQQEKQAELDLFEQSLVDKVSLNT